MWRLVNKKKIGFGSAWFKIPHIYGHIIFQFWIALKYKLDSYEIDNVKFLTLICGYKYKTLLIHLNRGYSQFIFKPFMNIVKHAISICFNLACTDPVYTTDNGSRIRWLFQSERVQAFFIFGIPMSQLSFSHIRFLYYGL